MKIELRSLDHDRPIRWNATSRILDAMNRDPYRDVAVGPLLNEVDIQPLYDAMYTRANERIRR